jgi:hypothetical protein
MRADAIDVNRAEFNALRQNIDARPDNRDRFLKRRMALFGVTKCRHELIQPRIDLAAVSRGHIVPLSHTALHGRDDLTAS